MATAVNDLKTLADTARVRHEEATQKRLAASDASHPMRTAHSPEALARDARMTFEVMGQTLVPELLRELEEARRLLEQRPASWDEREMRAVIDLAHENGWNGFENSKLLSAFLRDLVRSLRHRADDADVKRTAPVRNALAMLRDWWSGGALRYAEVSSGRTFEVMVTLWQINAAGDDVKVGHGEGATIEEAVQRAQGVIIL